MSNQRYILLTLIKILVVILLLILLFVAGTMIGVIGGGNPFKVFQPSLWIHIRDFFH